MNNSTRRNQVKKVFEAFREEPKTMKMVSVETGIQRANICWYIRDFREQNKIALVKEDRCPITKHPAQFLTTDPEEVEKIHSQLELQEV